MEDAGTLEEDDTDSQDSNIPIDHGHLAWNCSIKIIMLAVKALVISKVFYDGSAKFTTGDFECMVYLKKFTLQNIILNFDFRKDIPSYRHTFLHS